MPLTRRDALKTILVAAGTVAFASPALALPRRGSGAEPSTLFPQGVASGDPKPRSVILWTRIDVRLRSGEAMLRLQVAREPAFVAPVVDVPVAARLADDGCVRVKVTGLLPYTTYYYRFIHEELAIVGPLGRTRTAPTARQAPNVRFAFASCQDYLGRYYNSYLPLLQPENDNLAFLIHLGDVIYETTGDPQFQNSGGPRSIRFDDEAGALALGDPADPYFAAQSLDNYRQLHRTYRADPIWQQVLAKFPLVAIWDDHEFTDDAWQNNATYFNGAAPTIDERQTERLRNAERAWLEYMPIDDLSDRQAFVNGIDTRPRKLWPNSRIYRTLRYGRTVNLLLSDYRRFRPDHPVPEDAFPAAIVKTQAEVAAKYRQLGLSFLAEFFRFDAYVDWHTLSAAQQTALDAAFAREYEAAGYAGPLTFVERARQSLTGLLVIDTLNGRLPPELRIPLTLFTPRGLSYRMIGKSALFGEFGSRYALNTQWFDLFRQFSSLADEDVYGKTQQDFLKEQLDASTADWNVFCSSVSNTAMIVDLDQDFAQIPQFQQLSPLLRVLILGLAGILRAAGLPQITINTDQWDGFPNRGEALRDAYRQKGNVVLLAGDIHSSWVTDHSGPSGPLFEFTGTAISSTTLVGILLGTLGPVAAADAQTKAAMQQVAEQPSLIEELVFAVNEFLVSRAPASRFHPGPRQSLKFVDVDRNGIVVCDVTARRFTADYLLFPAEKVGESFYDDPDAAIALIEKRSFTVENGAISGDFNGPS